MAVSPGMPANVIVLVVLAFCAVMVFYGVWKVIRIMSSSRHRELDGNAMQMLYDVFKNERKTDEVTDDADPSADALKEFYRDVQPRDQRHLH